MSERIRVRSILGRFLEHSRVFRFGNGAVRRDGGDSRDAGGGEFWIGSADLMHRNLDRRVEALVEVTDVTARAELDRIMRLAMSEQTSAFELSADGTWRRRTGTDEHPLVDFQSALLRRIVDKVD
jgi:polyphosphate kinase